MKLSKALAVIEAAKAAGQYSVQLEDPGLEVPFELQILGYHIELLDNGIEVSW